jgi:hypothetical protein
MLPDDVRARLDRALAATDPVASVDAVVRSLQSEGIGQWPLYRLLGRYQSALNDPREEAVVAAMDLAWGAPWAHGPALFDRPLVEAVIIEARHTPYSVDEVVAGLERLDGRPVRVSGEFHLGMEVTSLWQYPSVKRPPDFRSRLAARCDLTRWLRLSTFGKLRPEGIPAYSNARQISTWLLENFDGHQVEVAGVVEAENTGHLGLYPAGVFILSIARASSEVP